MGERKGREEDGGLTAWKKITKGKKEERERESVVTESMSMDKGSFTVTVQVEAASF